MNERVIEGDYVVIGAGATAMAFADVILTESDRTIVMIDQHAQPGGHWNHAYSFVRLHQPSAFYGVSSRPLGRHRRDTDGLNEGLYEQATGAQVLSYFDEVMREQFLPTGRVTFLPMHEYLPDDTAVCSLTGTKTSVHARSRIVDARYFGSDVPSVHTPRFAVGDGVPFIPVNGLTSLSTPPAGYVVLGAGKTSVDACVWLLGQGVDPQKIIWVRPHDLWLLNRARVQPDASQISALADFADAAASAENIDDLVRRLERAELLLRIDRDHWPTTFRGATCAPREVELLRRIEHVVRLGHVVSLEAGVAHLEHGDLRSPEDWIYVDCTAEGIRRRPPVPAFQPHRITLGYVMPFGHPTYSAALIARTELASDDDDVKNGACPSLPTPNALRDVATYLLARLELPERWATLPGLQAWNDAVRLNSASWALADLTPEDLPAQEALVRFLELGELAQKNLRNLLAESTA